MPLLTTQSAKGYGFGSFSQTVANSYESISTTTITASGTTAINFNSIPSTYSHLQIRGTVRSTRSGSTDQLFFRANSSTSGYSGGNLTGNGTTVSSGGGYTPRSEVEFYALAGGSAASNIFGAFIIDILDYKNTNKNKTLRIFGGQDQNGSGEIWLWNGLWDNTSAITSIQMPWQTAGSEFVIGSQIALYGIKGA